MKKHFARAAALFPFLPLGLFLLDLKGYKLQKQKEALFLFVTATPPCQSPSSLSDQPFLARVFQASLLPSSLLLRLVYRSELGLRRKIQVKPLSFQTA